MLNAALKIPQTIKEVRDNKEYNAFAKDLSDTAILAAIENLTSDLDGRYPYFVTMPVDAENALKDYLLRTHEYEIGDFVNAFYEVALSLKSNLLQKAYEHLKTDLEDSKDAFILTYKPYGIRVHKNDLLNTLKKPLLENKDFIEDAADEIISAIESNAISDYAKRLSNTQTVIVIKTNNYKGERYIKQMM